MARWTIVLPLGIVGAIVLRLRRPTGRPSIRTCRCRSIGSAPLPLVEEEPFDPTYGLPSVGGC